MKLAKMPAVLIFCCVVVTGFAASRRSSQSTNELSKEEVKTIMDNAVAAAEKTASLDGLRSNTDPSRGPVVTRPCQMCIAIVDREGKVLMFHDMPDAWTGSKDIAVAKGRTAAFFSSNGNCITSRVLGGLVWSMKDNGLTPGPLNGINNSNQVGITGTKETRNGIITFPGGLPLYKNGVLVGGIGVSGDGVDQDESVAFAGAKGFEPGPDVVKLGYSLPAVQEYKERPLMTAAPQEAGTTTTAPTAR